MGSVAYGVSVDGSDKDVYGFCMPPKNDLNDFLPGFGRQKQRFDQYQQHHVQGGYDLTIYSIVKYFSLCMENNPNMIDALFTPANCVLYQSQIGGMVREKRREFLHKGSWHKFKGYAYSQLHKMASKTPEVGSKRAETREQYGFDVKFAYHTVRLLYEVEMILTERDIDLQRHNEHLKAIRRGEVSEADVRQWAADKERALERLYETSTIPYGPDEPAIRQLLIDCLEHHYGKLERAPEPDAAVRAIQKIQ